MPTSQDLEIFGIKSYVLACQDMVQSLRYTGKRMTGSAYKWTKRLLRASWPLGGAEAHALYAEVMERLTPALSLIWHVLYAA